MTEAIYNTDTPIDSRDVTDRIDELEDEYTPLDDAERAELASLKRLLTQVETVQGWECGITLTHEDDFERHVKDTYADDVEWIGHLAQYIDWEDVASDERSGYTELDWDGQEYLTNG